MTVPGAASSGSTRALGWNRTSGLRFRKPSLYPLSYEGVAAPAAVRKIPAVAPRPAASFARRPPQTR